MRPSIKPKFCRELEFRKLPPFSSQLWSDRKETKRATRKKDQWSKRTFRQLEPSLRKSYTNRNHLLYRVFSDSET